MDETTCAQLEIVAREELADLWCDLLEAQRSALNGRWSINCERVVYRIERLTRLVGPTHWDGIQISLLESGLYQSLHRRWGVPIEAPDMARIAEVRERAGGVAARPDAEPW